VDLRPAHACHLVGNSRSLLRLPGVLTGGGFGGWVIVALPGPSAWRPTVCGVDAAVLRAICRSRCGVFAAHDYLTELVGHSGVLDGLRRFIVVRYCTSVFGELRLQSFYA